MKTLNSKLEKGKAPFKSKALLLWTFSFVLISLISGCENLNLDELTDHPHQQLPPAFPNHGNLVEIESEHLNFTMPDEIRSGWTTFRYRNNSHNTHFILFEKMPVVDGDQKGIEEFEEQIAPVFQDAMNLINQGMLDEGFAEFARLPAWSSQVIYTGGLGLLAPGATAQTMMKLEPGVYVIECYIKTDGAFHSYNGMAKEILVTEESSSATPPLQTSLDMTLSSDGGIDIEGRLSPGMHTMAVHFEDQTVYGNFLGHDVHLVKLEEDTDIAQLENWMNWVNINGLETPAPATFLGGVQEMPAGSTAYVSFLLTPGRYAWIAEVPDPSAKGMFYPFTIPSR